jgi:peptidoglycan biosynthesis protein MviN/MurJ (putative lipid II flippase)
VLLLIQLSAKPEVGTMYAYGRTRTMGRIGVLSNVVAILGTLALVPWLGAGGALTALLIQALCFRIAVRIPSRRLRTIPFEDWWAVGGCATILAVYVVKLIVGRELVGELVLLVGAEAAWLGAAAFLSRDVFALLPARERSVNAA